jgi:hypothetical protein
MMMNQEWAMGLDEMIESEAQAIFMATGDPAAPSRLSPERARRALRRNRRAALSRHSRVAHLRGRERGATTDRRARDVQGRVKRGLE